MNLSEVRVNLQSLASHPVENLTVNGNQLRLRKDGEAIDSARVSKVIQDTFTYIDNHPNIKMRSWTQGPGGNFLSPDLIAEKLGLPHDQSIAEDRFSPVEFAIGKDKFTVDRNSCGSAPVLNQLLATNKKGQVEIKLPFSVKDQASVGIAIEAILNGELPRHKITDIQQYVDCLLIFKHFEAKELVNQAANELGIRNPALINSAMEAMKYQKLPDNFTLEDYTDLLLIFAHFEDKELMRQTTKMIETITDAKTAPRVEKTEAEDRSLPTLELVIGKDKFTVDRNSCGSAPVLNQLLATNKTGQVDIKLPFSVKDQASVGIAIEAILNGELPRDKITDIRQYVDCLLIFKHFEAKELVNQAANELGIRNPALINLAMEAMKYQKLPDNFTLEDYTDFLLIFAHFEDKELMRQTTKMIETITDAKSDPRLGI